MSTRSLIGKVLDDSGKCKVIYCHSDGYIDEPGVGWMLPKYYKKESDVDKLIALGDLSFLGETPEDDPKLWDISSWPGDYDTTKCRTYKGRGDKDVDAREYSSPRSVMDSEAQEYNYFYIDGNWYCIRGNEDKFIDLNTGEYHSIKSEEGD